MKCFFLIGIISSQLYYSKKKVISSFLHSCSQLSVIQKTTVNLKSLSIRILASPRNHHFVSTSLFWMTCVVFMLAALFASVTHSQCTALLMPFQEQLPWLLAAVDA